ncbi:hypothetical protein ACIBCA_03035 [Kitasatospora sp. NPDC051170]|uniref:SCO2583/SCO2584 N-terminal domain-containing protein n=1 Tax=Kitasatospora sp. NPDC051170 TaxID=3364056 RepID=UPI0037AF4FB7
MSSAEESQQPSSREPEPVVPGREVSDPFEGLVLDERFVRDAAVKEQGARARMLAARWRVEPPVDPGGRRWVPGEGAGVVRRRRWWVPTGRRRTVVVAGTAFAVLLAVMVGADPYGVLNWDGPGGSRAVPPSPRPVADVALPGGGVSDGSRCGAKGFHYFAATPASFTYALGGDMAAAPPPGPQLTLGSYGFERLRAKDPGHLGFGLNLAPGPGGHALDLSAPLGPQGVAVEIEGPDGLVAGAHGLPVTSGEDAAPGAGGTVHVGPEGGASVQVTLPVEALCPGFDGSAVARQLMAPIDSHNTVIGDPPYRLTVSISDPAIGAFRRQTGSKVPGDVLATDNRWPGTPSVA